jgi:hypothetical protein
MTIDYLELGPFDSDAIGHIDHNALTLRSLPALIKRQRERGDERPIQVLVDEILLACGFDEIEGGRQIAALKRRAAAARRAVRTTAAEKARFI